MKKKLYTDLIDTAFSEHIKVANATIEILRKNIEKSSDILSKSLNSGGTIFWCGNGGSAADSQHIAAEFVGRFKKNRKPLKSIA